LGSEGSENIRHGVKTEYVCLNSKGISKEVNAITVFCLSGLPVHQVWGSADPVVSGESFFNPESLQE
jgi:hypothetical protein